MKYANKNIRVNHFLQQRIPNKEEIIIIPQENNMPHWRKSLYLKGTALFIWNLINNGLSPNDILCEMLKSFDVTKETAELDLDKFYDDLIDRKLLRIEG